MTVFSKCFILHLNVVPRRPVTTPHLNCILSPFTSCVSGCFNFHFSSLPLEYSLILRALHLCYTVAASSYMCFNVCLSLGYSLVTCALHLCSTMFMYGFIYLNVCLLDIDLLSVHFIYVHVLFIQLLNVCPRNT